MKVIFSILNNNLPGSKKSKPNFGAGLTTRMIQEMRQADPLQISNRFARKGIPTDFKGNKVVAWLNEKTLDIFERFRRDLGLKTILPRGIFVEDFNRLNIDNPNAYSFCNLVQTELIKGSDEIIQPGTIFFNSLHNWEQIDSIADNDYQTRHASTNFFLYKPFHEFSHLAHENNLLRQYYGNDVLKKIEFVRSPKQIDEYKRKYGLRVSQICEYAQTDPLEAIACDIPRVVASSLDPTTLLPTRNLFVGTPYQRLSLWQRWHLHEYSDKERPLPEVLRNFWNGKFD